jgi:hypothetical protein
MNASALDAYQQRIVEMFPQLRFIKSVVYPENPNGIWLEYEVPNDELYCAVLPFAAELSMNTIIEYQTDITLIPLLASSSIGTDTIDNTPQIHEI